MKKRLRVGIIGCGKIAQARHIPEYDSNSKVEIIGYFDFNRERAEELAKKYGGKVFSSAEELIAYDGIDAVSICTTNSTHADIAVASMRAGKHVLCEKPMAVTEKECELMVRESKTNKRLLLIAHNQRLMPLHQKAKVLLEEGVIGKIISFKTSFGHSGPDNWSVDGRNGIWFFDKSKSAFGAMGDLGVHKLDLMRFLLGCEIKEVQAIAVTLDKKDGKGLPIDIEDNAIAIYKFENNIIGSVTASWTCYGKSDNDTIIYGSDGSLEICTEENLITVKKKNSEILEFHVPCPKNSGIIDTFVDAVLNSTNTVCDADDILKSMKALFTTFEAAESGNRVKL